MFWSIVNTICLIFYSWSIRICIECYFDCFCFCLTTFFTRIIQRNSNFSICCHIVLDGRKDELKAALTAAGIPVGVHYKPNHLLSLFRPAPGSLPLPVTEQLYGELVTLPMHPGLSAADVEHICDVITATLA